MKILYKKTCFTAPDALLWPTVITGASHRQIASVIHMAKAAELTPENKTRESELTDVSDFHSFEPVLKRLNILLSKGEIVVTWELEAGFLNLFFVFSGSFSSERNISSFLLRTFYVAFMFK